MSNSLISRITGTQQVSINEDDVVPVVANVTRRSYRDRLTKLRQRRGEDEDGNPLPETRSELESVLGEAKGDVIPDDAEELDQSKLPGNVSTRLNPIKDVVEEPARPRDPDEMAISPKSALTAPDATPDSMTPSDPSALPGIEKSSFTAQQAQAPVEEPEVQPAEVGAPEAPSGTGTDTATRTMDLLLGRRRVGSPAKKAEEYEATGAVTTEAQALSMLGMSAVGRDALLAQGQEMPPPQPGDNKAIYEAARRWV